MVVLASMLMLTTTSLTRSSTAPSPDCGVMLLSLLASRHVGEDAEDRVADLVRHGGFVLALHDLPGFGIELLQNKDAFPLREALADVFQTDKELGISKEKANSLHANLQQPALSRLNVLNWELAPKFHARRNTSCPSRCCSFHGALNAVVEITALLGVILLQLRLTTVPAPQTKNLVLGTVGHVDQALKEPAFSNRSTYGTENQAVVANLQE